MSLSFVSASPGSSDQAQQVHKALEEIYSRKIKFVLFGFLFHPEIVPTEQDGQKLVYCGVGGGGEAPPIAVAALLKAIEAYITELIAEAMKEFQQKQKGGPAVV